VRRGGNMGLGNEVPGFGPIQKREYPYIAIWCGILIAAAIYGIFLR
jgi:hypothetical protein